MARLLAPLSLTLLFGCATPMLVSTTPAGADITVDGSPVGKSPVTAHVDAGGAAVSVRAKVGGREVTRSVPKDQTNWSSVALGAGVGASACCAVGVVGVAASFVIPLAAVAGGCIGCGALVGAPVGAYLLWGSKPADQVRLDVGPGAPASPTPRTTPTLPTPPSPLSPEAGVGDAPPAPLGPAEVQPY